MVGSIARARELTRVRHAQVELTCGTVRHLQLRRAQLARGGPVFDRVLRQAQQEQRWHLLDAQRRIDLLVQQKRSGSRI